MELELVQPELVVVGSIALIALLLFALGMSRSTLSSGIGRWKDMSSARADALSRLDFLIPLYRDTPPRLLLLELRRRIQHDAFEGIDHQVHATWQDLLRHHQDLRAPMARNVRQDLDALQQLCKQMARHSLTGNNPKTQGLIP